MHKDFPVTPIIRECMHLIVGDDAVDLPRFTTLMTNIASLTDSDSAVCSALRSINDEIAAVLRVKCNAAKFTAFTPSRVMLSAMRMPSSFWVCCDTNISYKIYYQAPWRKRCCSNTNINSKIYYHNTWNLNQYKNMPTVRFSFIYIYISNVSSCGKR